MVDKWLEFGVELETLVGCNTSGGAADGRSVYVKNLPMNITVAELEKELSNFGAVKPGGVNVKNQKVEIAGVE